MNWIKCSDRLPKSGEKIVIKEIKFDKKVIKNLVVRIDNELSFWFMMSPFAESLEWKLYIEKEETKNDEYRI